MDRRNAALMIAAATLVVILGVYSRDIWIGFVFILLHEVVHIAAARLLGYSWGRLNLLPFGTSATLKEEFIRPQHDIFISSAGPLMNFAFFCFFNLLSLLNPNKINVLDISWRELGRINIVLCIFNLMPGEFLDGGRIIKSFLKLHAGFIWSYIAALCGGIITGGILVSGLIYYKFTINGIIIFSLGVYILWLTVHNAGNITLGIIRDEFYKLDYIKGLKRITIVTIGVYGREKIVDVIKHFCFNRYYNVCLMDENGIISAIEERQLYMLYCSYGNITIKDCITHIET